MKYRDFKILTENDMKKIAGGVNPPPKKCGTCSSGDVIPTTLTCYWSEVVDDYCVKPTSCATNCV